MERIRPVEERHMKLLAQRMQPLEELLSGLHDAHKSPADRDSLWKMMEAHREMRRQFDKLAARLQSPAYVSRTGKPTK